ncbi:MAG TPA: N-acetyltransferase [Caulobacteraceae bacterium]|jgi:putative acetyltransferase
MIIRDARPEDAPAIRNLVAAAFGRVAESVLVDSIVRDRDAEIALVVEAQGVLVGHLLLSRMTAPFRALALAPLSVAPRHQSHGIGSALVREAIEAARADGWEAIFVLGAPAYYTRFGFDPALAAGFASPYAGPAFMALGLQGPLPTLTGELGHAGAFADLDEQSTRLRTYREESD